MAPPTKLETAVPQKVWTNVGQKLDISFLWTNIGQMSENVLETAIGQMLDKNWT